MYEPTFMAYELRLLWHTNPNLYAVCAVVIGGGGGLQYVEVLHFMGREVQGRQNFRMQAVTWVVTKLQGDKSASFCMEMSGRKATGKKSASQSSMELYYLWISRPLCAS